MPADPVTLPAAEYAALRAKADAAGLLATHYVAYTVGSIGAGPDDLARHPGVGRRLAALLLQPDTAELSAGAAAEGRDLLDALVASQTAEPVEVAHA